MAASMCFCASSGVYQVHRADERRVEVVVVQLVDAHHPLAQLEVAMERRQVALTPSISRM